MEVGLGSMSMSLVHRRRASLLESKLVKRYPMYVVKLMDVMEMKGAPQPHQVLERLGLLVEWEAGFFTVFISHQPWEGEGVGVFRWPLQDVVQLKDKVKFVGSEGWVHSPVHKGAFGEPKDCETLMSLLRSLMDAYIHQLRTQNKIDMFRYLLARREFFCTLPVKKRTVSELVDDFAFKSLKDALQQKKGMGAISCALLSGDCDLLRELVALKARLHVPSREIKEMDVLPGSTPMHLAVLHCHENMEPLRTLLELRGDVNATDAFGTAALGHASRVEAVQIMLDHGAVVNQQKGPFKLPVVSSCILKHISPDGLRLLIANRAELDAGRGAYAFSPVSCSVLFPDEPNSLESLDILLESRADVNYRDSFHPAAVMMARAICFCRRKPPAVLKGIAEGGNTYPLLIASWFGSKEGAERLLAARADPTLKNTRGNSALTIWNHAHDAVTWLAMNKSACSGAVASEKECEFLSPPASPETRSLDSEASEEQCHESPSCRHAEHEPSAVTASTSYGVSTSSLPAPAAMRAPGRIDGLCIHQEDDTDSDMMATAAF
ncbi:unnamed protein product [Effrenium voratum]|nr:unnamed protein product [Effrenium voratum]